MELWIRSQDKLRLAKIEMVLISYNKRTEIIGNHKQLNSDDEDFIPLGEYETEERTLEVLDEIQKIIKWCQRDMKNVTIGDMNNLKGCFEDYVYEMPKE